MDPSRLFNPSVYAKSYGKFRLFPTPFNLGGQGEQITVVYGSPYEGGVIYLQSYGQTNNVISNKLDYLLCRPATFETSRVLIGNYSPYKQLAQFKFSQNCYYILSFYQYQNTDIVNLCNENGDTFCGVARTTDYGHHSEIATVLENAFVCPYLMGLQEFHIKGKNWLQENPKFRIWGWQSVTQNGGNLQFVIIGTVAGKSVNGFEKDQNYEFFCNTTDNTITWWVRPNPNSDYLSGVLRPYSF